ncbi:MAG: DHHA1 domain-containing protein [Ignavibacteriales bacterium]|nr:DHHA1 domain-containing protein [Ignavibacteriales bacterium]
MTPNEIAEVEKLINEWIDENIKKEIVETTIEQARELGAIALFNEKYGDKVRVIVIGDVSKELCGGTHVDSTGEIRLCKIISESAIAAGTRRIELVCGKHALDYLNNYYKELNETAQIFKTQPLEVSSRVEKLMDESKQAQKKIKELETEIAQSKVISLIAKAKDIKGGKLLAQRVDGLAPDALKAAVEKLSDKLGNSIVTLASVYEGKVSIVAKVSDNFVKDGVNAWKNC